MFALIIAAAAAVDGFAAGLWVGKRFTPATFAKVVNEIKADVQQIEQTVKEANTESKEGTAAGPLPSGAPVVTTGASVPPAGLQLTKYQ